MTFHFMGGDKRQLYLADYISNRGFSVGCSYLGGAEPPQWETDVLVLPLPAAKNGLLYAPLAEKTVPLEEIVARFRGRLLFGGLLPEGVGIDYYAAEEVLLANAALTAEAAVGLAIQSTPFALAEEPVLVLGAGRIGQLLALRLKALGARVTVAARRAESLALCRGMGVAAGLYEDLPYHRFRLILNTVPAPVLPLEQPPKGAILIELASSPGGFDPAAAEARGLCPLAAPGLPGRYSPETAAAVIGNYILKEMERLA